MRLSEFEIKSILEVMNLFYKDNESELYLYGSRVDDNKKGGDIDLLWVVSNSKVEALNLEKYKILSRIKNLIGDQKIDLSIISKPQLKSDIFYSGVIKTAKKVN